MAKSRVRDLEKLLKKALGDDVELLNQENTLLTAPGEHYGSIMIALKIKIRHTSTSSVESLDLVAKLIPANAMLRDIFDTAVTFKKESLTYTEAIPALVQLQKEHGFEEHDYIDKLFPRCFGARTSIKNDLIEVDEDAVILFENLKTQGYFTEDRLKGLDYISTKVILTDLARFHALSMALKMLKPNVFEDKIKQCLIKNKGFDTAPSEMRDSFEQSVIEGVKQWPELHQYLDRIKKILEHDKNHSFVNRVPAEPWGTVAHSDFWVGNTMILKDSDGKTVKSKIVDLQLINHWSCVTDLVFLLFTSVQDDVLDKHFDDFIKIYYDSLIRTLSVFKIDLNQFSFDAFLKELNSVGPTEIYHILVMLKPIFTEKGKILNDSENLTDEDIIGGNLLGSHHRDKIRKTVLALVKRGWL